MENSLELKLINSRLPFRLLLDSSHWLVYSVAGGFMMVNSVGVAKYQGYGRSIPVVGDVVEIEETQTTI